MFAPLLIDVGLPLQPRPHTGDRAMGVFDGPLPFDDVPASLEPDDLTDLFANTNEVEGLAESMASTAAAIYGESCRLSVRVGAVVAENRRLTAENAELRAALWALRTSGGPG